MKKNKIKVDKMNHILDGKHLWALIGEHGITMIQVYSKEYPKTIVDDLNELMRS